MLKGILMLSLIALPLVSGTYEALTKPLIIGASVTGALAARAPVTASAAATLKKKIL